MELMESMEPFLFSKMERWEYSYIIKADNRRKHNTYREKYFLIYPLLTFSYGALL